MEVNQKEKNSILQQITLKPRVTVKFTYQDASSKVIDNNYYLNASAANSYAADHSFSDYACTNCHANYAINLGDIANYLNGSAELPVGVSVKKPEDFDDIIEVSFTKSGTYKLTGSNLINGAYLDVKFIISDGVNVILDCDDAFLKNDKGVRVKNDERYVAQLLSDEPVYAYFVTNSGDYTLYNIVYPFSVGENATVNFSGKLFVDPFSEYDYVDMFEDGSDRPSNIYSFTYYIDNNKWYGYKYFVSGVEYDLSDYAVDFHCIKNVNNQNTGNYNFSRNYLGAYLYKHHYIPESSVTCTQCGVHFDTIYTVTIDDGSGTPTVLRIAEGDNVDRPSDPTTAPVGKKFDDWYSDAECTTKYDFTQPVSEDITIYAGW